MAEGLGAVVVLTLQENELPDQVQGGQHITLLYLGDYPLRQELYSDLLESVSTTAELYNGDGVVKTKKLERFGEDGDAVVLTLDNTLKSEPVQFRNTLISHLSPALYEVYKDAETYPEYKPHVTLGYVSEGFPEDYNEEVPEKLDIASISVWNGAKQTGFSLHEDIQHYGIIRRSGRYPWGSGANPFQRSRSFMGYFEELKAQGLSEKEIAEGLGLNTRELRQHRAMAKAQIKKDQIAEATRLKEKGWSNMAIHREMGIPEPTVRSLLDPATQARRSRVEQTVEMLKEEMADGSYLDFGTGSEYHLNGVTRHTLDNAITWLQDEGYEVMYLKTPQLGTDGKYTRSKVLVPEGTDWKDDLLANQDRIKVPGHGTEDGGLTWAAPKPPKNVDSKRVAVRYGPDGGADKDGIIELRPGVNDLDLGNARYAQVRMAIDGTHYLKGVAHYSDDLPDGVDVIFNTNKTNTGNPFDAMKPMSDDPENPWGAVIKEGGQRGSLNIVNEEGDWEQWSRNLSSQMLSKQTPSLARQQLDLTHDIRKAEYDEIVALNNPTIKRHLLEKFADGADSAAVHLKAKGLPRTQNHVILPVTNMKPTEIYAPGYNDGERVTLIRHPHAGIFEIPELTVNNRSRTARKIMGSNAADAVGIHPSVAEQLSGADFDGDTVLVIPNPRGQKGVRTQSPLKELEGFDPQVNYGADEVRMENGKEVRYRQGVPFKTMTNTQTEMGIISNLITDMSLQEAPPSEIANAVKHSMVVIDAEKHGLDYRQSYLDNNIARLKKKYQLNPETGRSSGASTLISRSSAKLRIPQQKPRPAGQGGAIDRETGRKVFVPTGETYDKYDKSGNLVEAQVPKLTKTTPMANTDDAHTLSSGTPMETVYADYANRMKSLGNQARKEAINTPPLEYSPSAFKAYAPQVQSLNAKLSIAKSNAPLERKAQVLANQAVQQKKNANPNMDRDDIKKEEQKALALYRARTGAAKNRVVITDSEWEAIQAGAVSNHKLEQILANGDLDQIKELATPRQSKGLSPAQISRARAMMNGSYTQAEVARALGVSTSTISKALQG